MPPSGWVSPKMLLECRTPLLASERIIIYSYRTYVLFCLLHITFVLIPTQEVKRICFVENFYLFTLDQVPAMPALGPIASHLRGEDWFRIHYNKLLYSVNISYILPNNAMSITVIRQKSRRLYVSLLLCMETQIIHP